MTHGIKNKETLVYVFKTNVEKNNLPSLKPTLDKVIHNARWNFDFEDCDRILRIVSDTDISNLVCDLLKGLGYRCEELE
jgi:hypothetical protein